MLGAMTIAWTMWLALVSDSLAPTVAGESTQTRMDSSATPSTAEEPTTVTTPSTWQQAVGGVRRYLERPLGASPRFGDHGVWTVAAVPGSPQRIRVETSLGLLDHLELGVTAHWLPGQPTPVWTPVGSVALFRSRRVEIGAAYHAYLFAPPRSGEPQPAFVPRARELVGSVVVSQWWFAAGVDLGAAWIDELDRFDEDPDREAITRRRLAVGMFGRFGNRRFGVIVQGRMPVYAVECALELRFDLFERRGLDRWGEATW